jgi:hypothetical protein
MTRYNVARHPGPTPLLYAISGVTFGNTPLLTTRGKGQPPLTALGFAVVRKDPEGNFTRTLTGSSMAAATFSGVAASLWSHAPTLSPDDVVRELYNESPEVPAEPDIGMKPHSLLASPFFQVRRITRCSAAGDDLGLAICTSLPDPVPTVPNAILTELPPTVRQQPDNGPIVVPRGIDPYRKPHVEPTPVGEPGCGACGVKLRYGRLDLTLRPSFLNNTISNMRLLVTRASTVTSFARSNVSGLDSEVPEPIASFDPVAEPFSVDLNEALLGTPIAAELAYQINVDGEEVDMTEPVLIEPDDTPPEGEL